MSDDFLRAYTAGAVAVIRALGFVGNAHYCSDCMNHFHVDRGQHAPGCSVAADVLADDDWWWVVDAGEKKFAEGVDKPPDW